jgi:hypothetical protein
MAAIVATLLYWPVGIAMVLVLKMFGVSFEAVLTFGGTFNNTLLGLVAWWMLAFAGSCIYAVCAFPWEEKVLAWPKKR